MMASKPQVSVIIIFCDAQKFLREAIASVFAQTYENWELILVDDGSTDDSSALGKSCAEEMPRRVRYFDHPGHENRGMSASRNLGIAKSAGAYMAMLDSDDVWLPRKLEQQVAILNAVPEAGAVYGRTRKWENWDCASRGAGKDCTGPLGVKMNRVYSPGTLLARVIRSKIASPSISNICFRREILKRSGGFEESFVGMYEDQVFLAKVFLKEAVFVSEECWDWYRIHPDSCTSVALRQGLLSSTRRAYLKWVEQYLREQGEQGSSAWRSVQVALYPYRHPSIAPFFKFADLISFRIRSLASGLREAVEKDRPHLIAQA